MEYYDLGSYGRPVTTSSAEAQTWFDRGLVWLYGYNHEEAIVCFEKAIEYDANCAMAHWGIAYAIGPNYNKPWDDFEPARNRQPWPWRRTPSRQPWRKSMPSRLPNAR